MFNKRLKQELSALREELSSLLQVKESLESEMLVLTLDSDGRIQSVNQNFVSEMLYKSNDLIGRHIEDLVPVHVKSDEFHNRFKAALTRGEHFAGAVRLLRGNGAEAWLRSIMQPVRSSDGRIKNFSIYSSDLTRTIEASREHENLIGALVRSTGLPFLKVAPARMRATRWAPLTARQRCWAASMSLTPWRCPRPWILNPS